MRHMACSLCKVEIQDEAHVLFFFKAYTSIRMQVPALQGVQ